MLRFNFSTTTLSTVALALLFAPASLAQTVYDFNQLNGSDVYPYTLLDGQDGWSEQTYNTARRCGVTATLSHDGTQSLQFQESGPGYGCDASRINDVNWSYTPFTGTETRAFFQADIKIGYWGGSFGPAHDTNNNTTIRAAEPGERGVRFNVGSHANVQLQLIPATGTATVVPLASLGSVGGGTWLRVRVVMDLTANAGTGLGYVHVQNMTAGQTWFTAVPGLQGIPLGLNPTATDATNPATWDAVWLHFEGATYGLDNVLLGHQSADSTPYETGCGSPALALQGRDAPILGATASTATVALPVGTLGGVLLIGFIPIDPGLDLTSAGLTGCRLALSPAASTDLNLSGSTATASLGIPNLPALLGARVYLQSAVVAPGVNPASVLTSNGLEWVLGLL